MVVELRAAGRETVRRAAQAVRRRLEQVAAAEGCAAELRPLGTPDGARMDPAVIAALERVCERQGRPWRRLASGAGHDAGAMAAHVPAGMLFVPSADGVSHSPREHTGDALLVAGAQALLEGVLEVLDHERPAALGRLNSLPPDEAERELVACCASRRWAAAVTAGRPYPTARALRRAAADRWWALTAADWRDAFAAHPRIGAAASGEQAGVATASPETLAALAEGNRRYEERFGHLFIVRAAGRGAAEMLAQLRERLANDPETELRTAAAEQSAITRLRLERLLESRG
jgi:2-oxo-4-hydroxy-4-carboxy-5-ureidoimidazoline decarboxylase